ncbi:MAG: hypothetical protein K2P95_04355 [Hyphomonadaceae bacterium]|nr:hypothetical protein [Hyphomonadaceae bacterium]
MSDTILLDTDVLILLRDGDDIISRKLKVFEGAILMSIISRVELEGGVHREPDLAPVRRARLAHRQ